MKFPIYYCLRKIPDLPHTQPNLQITIFLITFQIIYFTKDFISNLAITSEEIEGGKMQAIDQESIAILEDKILVVDDDEMFCKLKIQTMAKKQKIHLDYFTQADELEKAEILEEYDAIWIDYDLMETTGLAVAEDLNEVHPDIPVVMISTTNVVTDDMEELPNIRAILSKWDLTDDEIGKDLLASTLGGFTVTGYP